MSKKEPIDSRVERIFPAPGFREYQKEAITHVVEAFENQGKDVVLLSAPTGFGKSIALHTAGRAYYEGLREAKTDGGIKTNMGQNGGGSNIPESLGEGIFMTTPLNSLVDQYDNDGMINDHLISLKGRNNYECIHPEDKGTPVNEAICQRQDSFDCELKNSCPYYGRKYSALRHDEVVTNMSYIMAEGLIPPGVEGKFGDRDVLIVDECQSIEDFADNFISFTVSNQTVPDDVWKNISLPDEKYEDDMEYLTNWLQEEVLRAVGEMMNHLESVPTMSGEETKEMDNLRQFSMRVENFLSDVKDNEWVAQKETVVLKNRPNSSKWVFKPLTIGRFLKNLLWNRADKIILSSATIPGGDWLDEIGLGDAKTKKISVPSTFPVDNRPIITEHAVGKMTKAERDKNMLPMAKKIKAIADHHGDENGFIHCRSYGLMKKLARAYKNNGMGKWFDENCMLQDRYNREESLEAWINSDKTVFFSVAMDEGIDLEGDACRWQVLAKTLYKHMGDKRTRKRVLDNGDWDWYNRHAAIQLQQAYGRAVRSPEDTAVFYILDSSAVNLIKMNAGLFNKWFLEAIDDMAIDPSRGV